MASLERYRRSTGLSRNNSPQGSTSTASRSSTASTTGRGLTPTNENELRVGTRVHVQGKIGTIRYAGTTSFQTGKWIGIELDEPLGKNSGVVQGKRYFDCRMDHGVFVRPSQVKPLVAASTSEDGTASPRSSSSTERFAPPQDPGLAAARSAQQKTLSPSSTLLPSRITSPAGSRVSRLQQQSQQQQQPQQQQQKSSSGLRRPGTLIGRSSAVPTSSVTITPRSRGKSISGKQSPQSTRPRSGTQGATTNKEARERQLQLLRQQVRQQHESQVEDAPPPSPAQDEPGHTTEDEDGDEDRDEDEDAGEATESRHDDHPQDLLVGEHTEAMSVQQKKSSVYGTLAPSMPVSKSEQTVPMKDYEELRLKLRILETKRQEDRERQREHEKVKEEAEQFLTLRNKLQDKIGELQRELRETKRQLKENTSDKDSYEAKYNEVLESLEMMTLDKEVAEERSENLQQEVNVLKDKIEEISVDLDVLKKEADILNRAPEREGEERTPLEVIQLERHNERLKDALMRLRDATTEHEAELNRRIKSLEKDNYELEDFKIQYEKVKEELDSADLQIEDLKQRLDDAMGAEDLVDQLTEKNLSLTEKIEELRAAVEDLEALKELADELEDNHMETEKQLQAEIDHRDMLLREQLERLRSSEETNADYEATIQQFRELVINLQNDLEQLRHKEESQKTERQSLSSQSQAMMSLNMQLQSTVMKAQAKAIDLELRKLEAAQANDRLNYVQPYLPDSFFKTENDPISCLLLFKRLVFKSELIIKHLDQKHPVSEKIMDTVDENLVAVCELRQRAGWLGDLAKRFVTFIKHCRPEVFIRMGQVFHDLVGTERRLNGIVELLRTDELNETECIMDLQRMMAQLEHLTEVYLVQNGETILVDQFFGLTRALDFNADRMTVELTYIKQAVQNAVKENIVITEGQERLDMDYYEPLKRLVSDAKNSKVMAKKILRQLEDLSEQALMLKSEHLHRFKTLYAISSKLSQFCYDSYREISAYVDAKRGSKEEISLSVIQKIVYNKADEILEIAESTLWEGCIKTLRSLSNELSATINRVDNDNKMDKIAASTAPWIQRASDMKAEVVVSHDMERKLQQHSDEILKLIKDIKIKDQALQESSVKVELLEKRMIAAKKQADQIASLEDTLQKTQAQEQMYAEALDNLQAEYDALQQETVELKKRAAVSQEEQRQNTPKKAEVVAEVPKETDSNIAAIMQQLESLKAVIRFLRAENAHMKNKDLCYSLGLGDTVLAPEKSADPRREAVRSMAVESRALVKEMRAASASPKVVVLDSTRRGGKWQSRKKTPDYTYQTQQTVLHTLQQRSVALRDKVEHLRPATKPQPPQPSPASEQAQKLPSPSLASNVLSRSLAKIQIPAALSSPKRCHRIQLQSAAEFERIHALFIR